MVSSIPIQRLNILAFDNGLMALSDIKTLQEDLKNPATQIQAMKTAVSMIQQGHDLSEISSDVLKIFDTSNPKLKLLCNVYLRRCCMNRPACQLMSTHIFLKDFNDRNWVIQRCAAEYAVELGDEVLIKSYVYDIKRMSMHDKPEIRRGIARTLRLFHQKNRPLFFEQGLENILRKLMTDTEECVSTTAFHTLSNIELSKGDTNDIDSVDDASPVRILTTDELVVALENAYEEVKIYKMRSILSVLKAKKLSTQHVPLLRKLSSSSDVAIFYLASKKLLEISQADLTYVFEQACGFMNMRNEQLYNLLLFIETLASKMEPNSFHFAIHNEDPDYIIEAKMRIMFLMRNPLIEHHLKDQAVNPKYNIQILELCVHHDVVINNVLEYIKHNQLDILLKTLLKFDEIPEKWKIKVSSYMKESIWVDNDGRIALVKDRNVEADIYRVHVEQEKCNKCQTGVLALEVAGKYSTDVPEWIHDLEYGLYCNELIRFFLRLFNRGILDYNACLLKLKDIQTKVPLSRKARHIIMHITKVPCTSLSHLIHEKIEFSNVIKSIQPETYLDFIITENLHEIQFRTSLMKSKPYVESNKGNIAICATTLQPSAYRKDIEIVEKIPLHINTPEYEGDLEISENSLILRTENIVNPLTVNCRIFEMAGNPYGHHLQDLILKNSESKKHEITTGFVPTSDHGESLVQESLETSSFAYEATIVIEHPGIQCVLEIRPDMIGHALALIIGEKTYFVVLELQMFIKPLVCEEVTHDQKFTELEKYIITDTFDLKDVYPVNDTLFSFSLLEYAVYGRSYSNQIVFKSDSEILDVLRKSMS
ncbi:hypothetical protein PAEPH01_1219 [Pancytospora epiphaga]|nr:hypothetical protein PAEPH01_1219 [Pancytospora epiphaga]